MIDTVVTSRKGWKRLTVTELLAFAAIYFLWGGTFLAIRIAVLEIPPLATAGLRFFTAGALLYGFMRLRGNARPSLLEWRNLGLVALLMFVVTYGPLFWAAQYVSSSMVAVIEATLPITTIALEVLVFRSQPLQWRIVFGVGTGFVGVLMLLIRNTGQPIAIGPSLVILGAGAAWSLGAVLSKRLVLPASRPLSAGAQMMLGGLVLLALAQLTGEIQRFPSMSAKAMLALLYLVLFGSLIAYTAYVWLLGRFSATSVSSHAYVNPLVAVALGHFAAGEVITLRSLLASFIIAASVLLILTRGDGQAHGTRVRFPFLVANARIERS
jgi:drug/metabolite transporter (DMT)-like permease